MSVLLDRPDFNTAIADLRRRIDALERRLTPASSSVSTADEIVFSYAGALASSTSPPVRSRNGGILAVLAVTFGTAGSTSTTIAVKRNGTTVATVVVPSSTTIHNAEIGARFAADADVLTIAVTPGTGAADMTAAARFA